MKYHYSSIIGLAVVSGSAFAQVPALPIPAVPSLAVPALPTVAAVPDASVVTGALASGQATLTSVATGAGADAPALPGLPATPDATAVMDAVAEGETMLVDALPETGTLDVDTASGVDSEFGSLSSSYSADLPEEGSGVITGSVADEDLELAYGGSLDAISYSFSVAGEGTEGTVHITDPLANELPEAPELPAAPELPLP